MSPTSPRQIFVVDLSMTCQRPAQNMPETRFKQVFNKIEVIEFGLNQRLCQGARTWVVHCESARNLHQSLVHECLVPCSGQDCDAWQRLTELPE